MQLDSADLQELSGTQSSRLVLETIAKRCADLAEVEARWADYSPEIESAIADEMRRMTPGARDQWGVYEDDDGRLFTYWGSERIYA